MLSGLRAVWLPCVTPFERRGTHDLPAGLVTPPADWQIPFQALSEECRFPTDVAAVGYMNTGVPRRRAGTSHGAVNAV